jgi:hypothetical protein
VAVIKQVAVMTAAPVLENQVPKKGKGGRSAIWSLLGPGFPTVYTARLAEAVESSSPECKARL